MTLLGIAPADVDYGTKGFLPPTCTEASSIGITLQIDPERRYTGNTIAPFFGRLSRLGELQSNWNGYGAPPPNQRALSHTREALHLLHDENFPPSSLGPSADGGVTLSFFQGKKMAVFEFFNTGEIMYAFSSGPQQTVVEELESERDQLGSAIEALRWRLRG